MTDMTDKAAAWDAISEKNAEIARWKANHKDVVETKRGTDARLRVALAALQQIYDVCKDNASESCDPRMALDFVRQVAGDAFEKATHNVPRKVWTAEDSSTSKTCEHSPIICLDGKWHCQKCAAAIEMACAQTSS